LPEVFSRIPFPPSWRVPGNPINILSAYIPAGGEKENAQILAQAFQPSDFVLNDSGNERL
jgi:hypothetical protein